MIIVGNKNSCEVPVEVIENAIAALVNNGEQEEYRLGACRAYEADDASLDHSDVTYKVDTPEL